MTTKRRTWTGEYFAQANRAGPNQGDVPSLLRRVAKSLEKIGPVSVDDLVLHTQVTADGPWHSISVYFHRLSGKSAKNRKRRKVVSPSA